MRRSLPLASALPAQTRGRGGRRPCGGAAATAQGNALSLPRTAPLARALSPIFVFTLALTLTQAGVLIPQNVGGLHENPLCNPYHALTLPLTPTILSAYHSPHP